MANFGRFLPIKKSKGEGNDSNDTSTGLMLAEFTADHKHDQTCLTCV